MKTTSQDRPAGIPNGYSSVNPWIITRDTAALITFATEAFDAVEIARVVDERGVIGHAEFRIGDSMILAFDTKPHWPPTPAFLRLYVEDANATAKRAIEAGAESVSDVTHLPWGDRVGRIRDPLGNLWWIQARVENVDLAEMTRRMGEPIWQERMAYMQGVEPFAADREPAG